MLHGRTIRKLSILKLSQIHNVAQVAAIIIQGNIRRLLARVKARLARGAKRARAQARLARAARERAAYVRGKQLDERQREEGAIMMKVMLHTASVNDRSNFLFRFEYGRKKLRFHVREGRDHSW